MNIKDINANLVGLVGLLIFVITGILSKGLTEFFVRTANGVGLALYDVDYPMYDNTSPQFFALQITLLLMVVFGAVFATTFRQYKIKQDFQQSGLSFTEYHYREL